MRKKIASSRDHIPKAFHHLMTDDLSPIIDFYPVDFDVDMDGKKWEWQGKLYASMHGLLGVD